MFHVSRNWAFSFDIQVAAGGERQFGGDPGGVGVRHLRTSKENHFADGGEHHGDGQLGCCFGVGMSDLIAA